MLAEKKIKQRKSGDHEKKTGLMLTFLGNVQLEIKTNVVFMYQPICAEVKSGV